MRKSSTKTRLLRAGVAVGAAGAAALFAPQAAHAVISVTTDLVMPGDTVTITDTTTSPAPFTGTNGSRVQVITGTTCNARYQAAGPGVFPVASADTTSSTTVVTFEVPAEATPGPNGVVKQYRACVYSGEVVGTSTLQPATNTAGYLFNVGLAPRLNTAAGPSGGTNNLTVTTPSTAAIFTGVASVGAYFSSATSCPTTYGTPGATFVASNVSRLSNTQTSLTVPAGITSTGTGPKTYSLCLYNGATATSPLLSSTNYTVGKIYLSSTSGPSAGGNGITITATDAATYSGYTPGVVLVSAITCPTNYSTTVDLNPTGGMQTPVATTKVRKLSDTQVAFTVPVLNQVADWTVCTYNSSTNTQGTVQATANYTTIAAAIPTAIRPSAGPATGGTEITVSGTDFPTTPGSITATLGGVALENIRPQSANAFRATTPAHSVQANSPLVVTTASGVRTLTNAFSFQNEIVVAPRTAPNTSGSVDVKVAGSGFLSYNWPANPTTYGTNDPAATDARIYLVRGTYNGAAASTGRKATPPVSECWNVLVINDETLVCSLVLDRRFGGAAATTGAGAEVAFPTGYSNTTGTTSPDVTTSTTSTVWDVTDGTFTQDDVGQPISDGGTKIQAGTTITAVLSPTRIVVSQVGTGGGGAAANVTVGGAVRTTSAITGLTATAGDTSVTSANAVFSQADVGRAFGGFTTGNIANGTVILAVSADGKTAYLNQGVASNVVVGDTGNLYAAAPVPNGAYTLTVVSNAAVGAATSDPAYSQSVVSSGSTFTVAPS